MKTITKILIFLLTCGFIFSCNSEKNKIPYVYVDITIDLNKPEFASLSAPGGYCYITGGFRGIVIYRIDYEEFKAYERACPYDPECGKVVLNTDSLFLIDSCCGSKFSLKYDGVVIKGPSQSPLVQYRTIFFPNSNTLRITNQ